MDVRRGTDGEGRVIVVGVTSPMNWSGRMIFGVVILTLGVLWTLDNLGVIDSDVVLQWWPLVVVVVGLAKLLGIGTHRHTVWGLMFVFAGLWLLVASLDWVELSPFDLWPLGLVVLGYFLITRSLGGQRANTPVDDRSARINSFDMWGGTDRKSVSEEFRGGEVTAVMGGSQLDLRGARAVPGGAVLDLFVWWGGVDILVPEHWEVVNQATAFMGGIEDKSKAPPAERHETLVLRGLVIMGGVEIKN